MSWVIIEAEVGEHFEANIYWYNCLGALHHRPGFRMLEIHDLYFYFMVPWWIEAIRNPVKKCLIVRNLYTFKRTLKEKILP